MNDRPVWTSQSDLASRRFGGTVMWATDELFAEKENLINAWPPAHRPEREVKRSDAARHHDIRHRRAAGVEEGRDFGHRPKDRRRIAQPPPQACFRSVRIVLCGRPADA